MPEAVSATPVGGFLLTGGTGLIGGAIAGALLGRGLRVLQATRAGLPEASNSLPAAERLTWDPRSATPFKDPGPLEGLTAAIHLSGANLAGRRWTPAYKREIVSSRTKSTEAISRALAGLRQPPRVLITASATGLYGDRGDEVLTEESLPGQGFLSETCVAWEEAARPAVEAGIRVVHLRLGVVLTPKGGALAKVLPLFRLGLGGRLGDGKQWMNWVALDDVVRAVLYLVGLDDHAERTTVEAEPAGTLLHGAVNCIAPAPITNAEYTRALARVLHRPAIAPAPAFALRLVLGEMADAALLASCRAVPEKLLAGGFRFGYPELGAALAHLLAR